jgi:hypothetical protein
MVHELRDPKTKLVLNTVKLFMPRIADRRRRRKIDRTDLSLLA